MRDLPCNRPGGLIHEYLQVAYGDEVTGTRRYKKTRPTRSRVVYAATITLFPCEVFRWDPCSCYQPTGRRYWPTGSGS